MSRHRIAQRNVALLKSATLALPKSRTSGDFGQFLERTFADFHGDLGRLVGPLRDALDERGDRIRTLTEAIADAWRLVNQGDADAAKSRFATGLEAIRPELLASSRRHSARVLPDQSWYRLAWWDGVRSRAHMFHAPFERSQVSYRFSTPGSPTLYLANSVYLCWLECGEPEPLDRCFLSRFEIDFTGFDVIDIPSNSEAYVWPLDVPDLPGLDADPSTLMNSPYADDVTVEVAEYLTTWPLLAATTVRKLEPAPPEPPEYLLPQLLMSSVKESREFLGVRYFTSKHDPSTNSNDWPINLALPTRTEKDSGYCDFLRSRTRCTEPQPLALMREFGPNDLATDAAADRRQERSGRYMLVRNGDMTPYYSTEFGKMEYWLDRPELAVAPI